MHITLHTHYIAHYTCYTIHAIPHCILCTYTHYTINIHSDIISHIPIMHIHTYSSQLLRISSGKLPNPTILTKLLLLIFINSLSITLHIRYKLKTIRITRVKVIIIKINEKEVHILQRSDFIDLNPLEFRFHFIKVPITRIFEPTGSETVNFT